MLVHRTIKAPGPKSPRGPPSWPLRRPLTPKQFLEVDPFPLRLSQQSGARLCLKVANDDTSFLNESRVISSVN
jgi:hypothetical protein